MSTLVSQGTITITGQSPLSDLLPSGYSDTLPINATVHLSGNAAFVVGSSQSIESEGDAINGLATWAPWPVGANKDFSITVRYSGSSDFVMQPSGDSVTLTFIVLVDA